VFTRGPLLANLAAQMLLTAALHLLAETKSAGTDHTKPGPPPEFLRESGCVIHEAHARNHMQSSTLWHDMCSIHSAPPTLIHHVRTCMVSPAAKRRCCPIGDSVGKAFVVNLRVKPALASLAALVVVAGLGKPSLSRFVFLGGDRGLLE
jgi:hypothetical protein